MKRTIMATNQHRWTAMFSSRITERSFLTVSSYCRLTIGLQFVANHINKLSSCSTPFFPNLNWHYFRMITDDLKLAKMKTAATLLIGAVIMTPLVLYTIRRVQSRRMRRKIASEGFETATDILYPGKSRMFRQYRIGPVLPQ
jgi:hypothetical protein